MLSLTGVRVYLAMGDTDMRMSINGLSVLVSTKLAENPLSGHLFAFTNRKRTIVKILYWDRNGFCLWQKRLEKDVFKWPASEKEVLNISSRELQWLIDGLDIRTVRAHKSLEYSVVC
jgi:transposase